MKVALLSYAYAPSIGGLEFVSEWLAAELRSRGHEVRVVTFSPGNALDGVIRHPSVRGLLSALRWSEVVIHSHFSLRLAWPLLIGLARRPRMVVLHGDLAPGRDPDSRLARLKYSLLPYPHTYGVSRYVTALTGDRATVMPNPYDEKHFVVPELEDRKPTRQLLFVGRLARAKGLDVLLEALALLRDASPAWHLTVIGDGPERTLLEAQASRLGLDRVVDFLGAQGRDVVAREMRNHAIVVVPSRREPPEAFGVVALEAIACGAVPVVAAQGGLPDAIGDCGMTFAPEEPSDLASTLHSLGGNSELLASLRSKGPAHLRQFSSAVVGDAYEAALAAAVD